VRIGARRTKTNLVERLPFRKRCADASAASNERRHANERAVLGRAPLSILRVFDLEQETYVRRLATSLARSNIPASPQAPPRSLDGEQRCGGSRDGAAPPSLQALGAASSAFSRARVVERSTHGSRQLERLAHGVTVTGTPLATPPVPTTPPNCKRAPATRVPSTVCAQLPSSVVGPSVGSAQPGSRSTAGRRARSMPRPCGCAPPRSSCAMDRLVCWHPWWRLSEGRRKRAVHRRSRPSPVALPDGTASFAFSRSYSSTGEPLQL
jgi:hypothetical protein